MRCCTECHLDVAPDHDLVHPLLGALLPAHRVLQVLALLAVRRRAHGARGVVNLRNTRQLRTQISDIDDHRLVAELLFEGEAAALVGAGPAHRPAPAPSIAVVLSTIYTCPLPDVGHYVISTHTLSNVVLRHYLISAESKITY